MALGLEKLLQTKKICIVLHTFTYGPPQALKDFLRDKIDELIFIGHPFIYCKDIRSFYESEVLANSHPKMVVDGDDF